MNKKLLKTILLIVFCVCSGVIYAADASSIQISGISDMLSNGETMLKVFAKWGGIATVVGAALALGTGRLEGALAHTVCKVLIVIGLLISAFGFFSQKMAFGFAF